MLSGLGSQDTQRPGSGADLWRDPPWMQVKLGGGYQMGLAPESLDQWLPRLATTAEFERKAGLMRLRHLPEPVYQSLPDSGPAERLAANAVMAHLSRHHSRRHSRHHSRHQAGKPNPALRMHSDLSPLGEAALQVPDDLCVLRLDAQVQQFRLVAASLCSPSYWSLSEKLGLPLSAIHEPVPGLNAQLGARMQKFFLQMPAQRCFVRRNFFVHAQQDLYQPKPDTTNYRQVPAHQLLLRCERQSLVRLGHDLVLFSIRVDLAPLAEARQWPNQAFALQSLLDSLSDVQLTAFGGPIKLELVSRYLASQAAAGLERQR